MVNKWSKQTASLKKKIYSLIKKTEMWSLFLWLKGGCARHFFKRHFSNKDFHPINSKIISHIEYSLVFS